MLAISPLETAGCNLDGRGVGDAAAEDYVAGGGLVGGGAGNGGGEHDQHHQHQHQHDSFADAFSSGNLQLEDINFDDLFVGFDDGTGDILPDLELDPDELLGVFNTSFEEDMEMGSLGEVKSDGTESSGGVDGEKEEGDSFKTTSDGGDQTVPETTGEDVKVSESVAAVDEMNRKARKSTAGGMQKKRKIKVDWTPELHRRFVEAVDQLGVEKAVPSRILEIMGIDCLTRHNIASHLQKYRSHRKHVLAREAEAASWTHRRKIYSPTTSTVGHVVPVLKRETIAPWMGAPATMGFPTTPLRTQPPPPPAPPSPSIQSFRPLHVWGHPTVEHHMIHMWPKHVVPSHPPHHHWAPPPHDPSAYWLPPHYQPKTPHYPHHPPLPPQRFSSPSPIATGIPPFPPPPPAKLHHQFQPTKEIIDKVIGDVLTKPWLPLALGLKPPSVDSVLVALQREGITKIPSHPSSSSSLCS